MKGVATPKTTSTSAQNDADNISPTFWHSPSSITQHGEGSDPFGGLASFFAFLERIELPAKLQESMPFVHRSPNSIPPAHTLTAFICSVVVGASRFAHSDWLRSDKALHAMLGLSRFPGTDTIRNFFARFTQGSIEAFWRPLWRSILPLFLMPEEGYSLDLDSTIFQRSGHQQGAAKGYNPHRPGRLSHHPLLAMLAEAPCVLHAWLRSGNTSASRGVSEFLKEALALMPPGWRLRRVRADSGFFAEGLLEFLEDRSLPYVIVARLTKNIKTKAAALSKWTLIDEDYEVAEFWMQLYGWKNERRFFVIRERIRESKAAIGRKLLHVPGYTFRIFVTNCSDDPLILWRDYNKRALIESRIEELKAELNADGFCMKNFYASESAFLAVLFTFNLLSLYGQALQPQAPYRQPATLRQTVFLGGAILGRAGHKAVLHISSAWGGMEKHKPLLEAILHWKIPTSPKFRSQSLFNPPLCPS